MKRSNTYAFTVPVVNGEIATVEDQERYDKLVAEVAAVNIMSSDRHRYFPRYKTKLTVRKRYRGPRRKGLDNTISRKGQSMTLKQDARSADVYVYRELIHGQMV